MSVNVNSKNTHICKSCNKVSDVGKVCECIDYEITYLGEKHTQVGDSFSRAAYVFASNNDIHEDRDYSESDPVILEVRNTVTNETETLTCVPSIEVEYCFIKKE